MGPTTTPPGKRPCTEAPVDAGAAAALCAGGEDGAAAPAGPREPPRGVRHAGSRRAGAGDLWLADPDGLCRAAQPGHPAARGGSRASCQHTLQGGGRCAAAARLVPDIPQLLLATWQLTPALAAAPAPQWPWLRQALAITDAGHGRRTNGSRLDAARGAALSRAAVASARGGMSTQGGGKRPGEAA